MVALVWASTVGPAVGTQPETDSVLNVVARPIEKVPALMQYGPDRSMNGFQIELLRSIAASQVFGIEETRFEPQESVRSALTAGTADIIPLMVIDDSTKAVFALSEPVVSSRIVVFANWKTQAVSSFAELPGHRVVAVRGDIAAARLTDSGIPFVEVDSASDGFRLLGRDEAEIEQGLVGRCCGGRVKNANGNQDR